MEPNKKSSTRCRNEAVERELAWGAGLHAVYDDVAQEPLPDRFRELLEQLDEAQSRRR